MQQQQCVSVAALLRGGNRWAPGPHWPASLARVGSSNSVRHSDRGGVSTSASGLHTQKHICVHICTHEYIHVFNCACAVHVCMMFVCECVHTTMYVWIAEDSFVESVLSFHFYVGSGDQSQALGWRRKCL